MKLRFRGYALALVLLLVGTLLVSVVALLATAGRNLFTANRYEERSAATRAAEAGLARALSTLEQNQTFSGTISENLNHAGASFELIFASGAPTATDSVNNLASDAPRSAPAGDVPPHSAFLVSRGRCRGSEVILKALVEEAEQTVGISVLASNRIQLFNKVKVRGIESFSNNTEKPVDIHSNRTDAGVSVSWAGSSSTDKIESTGRVTTSSSEPGSISLAPRSNVFVGDELANQPRRPHLNYDIVGTVAGHSSAPGALLPTVGSVTLGPGDHYYGSSQTIHGDLILQDGAKLYIKGDLTVNGSLTGVGLVAATGFTELKGDASLSTADGDYIALMSREGVSLTGFDGTNFLDALATSNPTAAVEWPRLKSGIQTMQDEVGPGLSNWLGEANDDAFDAARGSISVSDGAASRLSNVLPTGPTGDFLQRKFYQMRLFYHSAWHDIDDNTVAPYSTPGEKLAYATLLTNDFLAGDLRPDRGGIADAVSSQDYAYSDLPLAIQQAIQRVVANIQAESVDKVGAAFFKGLIYTNGPLYVANEVTLVGALEAQGLPSVRGRTVHGVALEPGDVYLGVRSDLMYVADLLKSPEPLGRSGLLKVVFQYEDRS